MALRLISSMATRQLLADLVARFPGGAQAVAVESVGGVDAAKRVQAGEAFDVVVLAGNAIDKLIEGGHALPGSRVDLVRSDVWVAVRAGAPRPDIGNEDAVRRAVLAARTIGYSTGPSGVALERQFQAWGIADEVRQKVVQAAPGVPVGTLVARGDVDLGFQQYSELMSLSGIDLVGPLPPAIQVITTFAGAVCATAADPDAVRALLRFMASAEVADVKRANGMQPA